MARMGEDRGVHRVLVGNWAIIRPYICIGLGAETCSRVNTS